VDDNYRSFYQIFVGSFSDSNNDGIGDLRGIINRFDYLNDGNMNSDTSLGVQGIWLSPIFTSPTYHKYDTTDYYEIDWRFGTEEDLKELIELCHSRNVKIILDLVINHTSSSHPWFQEFKTARMNGDETNPYYNYYSCATEAEKVGGVTYQKIAGVDCSYECNFSSGMPELNFEKPWWDAGSVETLSVGDSLFMVNGDIHLMYGESAWVLFFNKNMLAEYNLESPYTVIKEGRWTFDKMYEMISGVALDLNGDGVLNSDDQFGLATHSDFSLVLLTSAGEGLLYKNENNIPEWKDLPEKVFNLSEKIHQQFFDLNLSFQQYLSPIGSIGGIVDHFMQGKSLFLCEVLGHAKTLRDMEDNFGIIPTPKYDETQENYNTFIARSAQTLMVPVTNRELSRTAVILENLGAESFKSLRPAYYDVQLSGKTARDADSLEMLDIIFDGRRYEMAYIFGANTIGSAYITATETGGELASAITKVTKAAKKNIEKTLSGLLGE
jgi:hypothetical protein